MSTDQKYLYLCHHCCEEINTGWLLQMISFANPRKTAILLKTDDDDCPNINVYFCLGSS